MLKGVLNMNSEYKGKRTTWLDVLLISTIILLTVCIVFFIISNGDSKFQSTTASAKTIEDYSSSIEQSNSKFLGITINTEKSNNDLIPFYLVYPQTSFDSVNQEISTYIEQSKETYLNEIRLKKNVSIDTNSDLRISTKIYEHQKQYYSIVLTRKVSFDGAKYDTTIQTYFFDKQTGQLLSMRDLLDEKVSNLEVFAQYIRSQLLTSYNNYLIQDNAIALTEPKWRYFNRFAIINDTLVVYYDKNEIANVKAGMPTVKISLSYLNPILVKSLQTTEENKNTIIPVKSASSKRVALTFDDGPYPKVTKQILKTLEKYDAKATFFMVGYRVEAYPSLVREVKEQGHEIGNHTWNHPTLTNLNSKQVLWQLEATNNALNDVIGEPATVFRPPYGATNKRVTNLITETTPVAMWSLDTLDWKHRNSDKLLPMVKKSMHNNAIILMHDIHQSTADGLDSVLAYLQEEGYEFVTVSEILPYRD